MKKSVLIPIIIGVILLLGIVVFFILRNNGDGIDYVQYISNLIGADISKYVDKAEGSIITEDNEEYISVKFKVDSTSQEEMSKFLNDALGGPLYGRLVIDYKNEKYSEMNRNFGWMPLPTKLDENDTNANGDPYATLDSVCAYAIARNDVSDEIKNLIKIKIFNK